MSETIRTVIMWACLGVLAVVAPVGLYLLFRDAIRLLRQSLSSRELLVFAVLAVGLSFAAQKRGLITFPRTDSEIAYLTDNGSYIETTDVSFVQTVHIDFKRVVAPATATVYVDYRQRSDTNGVWTTHTETTFAQMALPYEFQFPNATNYNWIVYTDWTPGPTVVTNGVWHAHWGIDRKFRRTYIPIRTAVRVDGDTIATPKSVADAKKKEEENNEEE